MHIHIDFLILFPLDLGCDGQEWITKRDIFSEEYKGLMYLPFHATNLVLYMAEAIKRAKNVHFTEVVVTFAA